MTVQTLPALYDIPIVTISGEVTTLRPYYGQVMLIVNVASRCGFTPQYEKLQALYERMHPHGLVVLGFPCDQFLHQEPGSNEEIQSFAEGCYRVTFPLFAKIKVKGAQKSPLYAYLSTHIKKKAWPFIPWNFTKVLVNAEGQVLRRYLPTTSFETITQDIASMVGV